jgi:CHAD domain-containing protein
MSGMADALVAQVLRLEITVYACSARLAAGTDPEALHDLRIALRTLRSLLRPLRQLPGCAPLREAAAKLARLSGPLRDEEVLLAELEVRGMGTLAASRREALEAGYAALLDSEPRQRLHRTLDAWPALWRRAQRDGLLQGLRKRLRKRLGKQRRRLAEALRDPAHDRHRLRLLIKRVRYAAELYPESAGVPAVAYMALKQAQSALGHWHDHLQWLARAESEPALQPLRVVWREALLTAERESDKALLPLLEYFRK